LNLFYKIRNIFLESLSVGIDYPKEKYEIGRKHEKLRDETKILWYHRFDGRLKLQKY